MRERVDKQSNFKKINMLQRKVSVYKVDTMTIDQEDIGHDRKIL